MSTQVSCLLTCFPLNNKGDWKFSTLAFPSFLPFFLSLSFLVLRLASYVNSLIRFALLSCMFAETAPIDATCKDGATLLRDEAAAIVGCYKGFKKKVTWTEARELCEVRRVPENNNHRRCLNDHFLQTPSPPVPFPFQCRFPFAPLHILSNNRCLCTPS